ncbi:MAG: multiheme c-type cytochrome [Myxococcota bacterium]
MTLKLNRPLAGPVAVTVALCASLLTLAAACPKVKDAPASTTGPAQVNLVFQGSVRGWVEPCGCTVEPLGGVHRVKAEVDKVRQRGATLVLDAGGLLFDRTEVPPAAQCQEDARVKLLLAAARSTGVELTTVGTYDLAKGDAYRAAVLKEAGITAVSANVEGAAGVVPRALKDVGGMKVGVTGVTWPEDVPAAPGAEWKSLRLKDPREALAREVAALRGEGAQLVVVLAQLSRAQVMQLMGAVKGVDLVMLGWEPGESPASPQEVVPGTWLLAAGAQAQYLGKVAVTVKDPKAPLSYDDNGARAAAEAKRVEERIKLMEAQVADFQARGDEANVKARQEKIAQLRAQRQAATNAGVAPSSAPRAFTFEALPLDSKVASDGALADQLQAYKTSLPELNARCEQDLTCPPAPEGKPRYVGTAACVDCHAEAADFWKKAVIKDAARAAKYARVPGHPNPQGEIGHARAWRTLEEAKATGNRDCIACHTVGFEQPGGFCKTSEASKWAAVGCESCHGPGSAHVDSEEKQDIRLAVPEEHCRECHHVPHIESTESFVYKEKLKVILGPGHGAARLKALLEGK